MKQPTDMTVSELQAETDRCEASLGEAERVMSDLRTRLNEIRAELSKRLKPSPEPRVSDHALLRYVERVIGVDTEALRAEILTDGVRAALKSGATGVTINGVKFIAKDGVIVTTLDQSMRPKRRTKRGWRDLDDMDAQLAEMNDA